MTPRRCDGPAGRWCVWGGSPANGAKQCGVRRRVSTVLLWYGCWREHCGRGAPRLRERERACRTPYGSRRRSTYWECDSLLPLFWTFPHSQHLLPARQASLLIRGGLTGHGGKLAALPDRFAALRDGPAGNPPLVGRTWRDHCRRGAPRSMAAACRRTPYGFCRRD